ncbi:CDP-alcohol phosphatidyltransferase family protein [Paeniglutamicibacter gangotriensis]|uniref:CDP-alcohol phosphatidyltransferase n=1 Tax=Paeniglutamicibacter gangotriensis Lz1y TaxID=1276920 RepID=M7NNK3_9MICC|nr:CDP-alcohol phosphatidyltransferase family protein [Paeniglutamicibacter gangotriensis]EMR00134.1 CDP-alcohol phosphatidyltransferase [Paeniglutamicibacter gangotriensis Lz1y]
MHRFTGRSRHQALTDVLCAIGGSVVLGAVLVHFGKVPWWEGLAAVAGGLALVSVSVLNIVRRDPMFSTAADRVTLSRAVLGGGCATLIVLAALGSDQHRSWWLVLLAGPAVLLDAVDGAVARRTGTASAQGSRLDMETDAALMLVLSVPLAFTLGPWVLAIGLMRYGFVALSWRRPALQAPLEFSRFRRIVAAIQSVVLVAALVPSVPVPLATATVAFSLALLVTSFARDVVTLERRQGSGTAEGKSVDGHI